VPLLNHVDGIEESDARVGGKDVVEGLITRFRGLDEGTPVAIVPINQELPEILNKGATNSFYEWVKKTKEEIEKIESGSSSDEDSEVNIPEDIHMASTERSPQLGVTLDQYSLAYLRKQGSANGFQNSSSELESDDDKPPPLLLTRMWQYESSSDEETDDEGMVAISWPRVKPMYRCLAKSEPCPQGSLELRFTILRKRKWNTSEWTKGDLSEVFQWIKISNDVGADTTFEPRRDKDSTRRPSGLRNREINVDKLEGTEGFSNHFGFRKNRELITNHHGDNTFHRSKKGGIR
jgi:hypothetical protein